jgi:xanthine/uracil permease
MGVSFATFSPADKVLKTLIKEGNSFEEAYGMVLGTAAICALVPVAISFLPHRVIRKVFPPVVCGLVIMLIGINLGGVGIKVGGSAGGRAGGRAGGQAVGEHQEGWLYWWGALHAKTNHARNAMLHGFCSA